MTSTLFREGLSDVFALSDKLLSVIREIDEDAIPSEYRIPDPEEQDTPDGSVWSFALPESGLDEQIQLSCRSWQGGCGFLVGTRASKTITQEYPAHS